MLTLSESMGRGARAIRVDAGLTLEAVATSARLFGLPWSTGKVSDFEAGRVAPSLPTLVAIALALGDAAGRRVRLAELFTGEETVNINEELSVDMSVLRAALSGEDLRVPKGRASGRYGWTAGLATGVTVTPTPATIVLPKWARGVEPLLYLQVRGGFRESDARMCKNIGVTPEQGAAAMAKLWGRTFSAERDRRAGPEANAQRRGQISRQLKVDLQRVINDGNN